MWELVFTICLAVNGDIKCTDMPKSRHKTYTECMVKSNEYPINKMKENNILAVSCKNLKYWNVG